MKTITLGQGRGKPPVTVADASGRIFSAGDDPVPTSTLRVSGKTHFFGTWRASTEGGNYERWSSARTLAENLVNHRRELEKSGMFTEQGVNSETRHAASSFLVDKVSTLRKVEKEIAKVTENGEALFDLDWDINSPYHDRLVKQWQVMPEDIQKAMLRKLPAMDVDLRKALIREPQFTSGIDDETRASLRESLLTDDEKVQNEQYRADLAQLTAIVKAYDVATDVVLEQAQTTEDELMVNIIVEDDDEQEPPPEEGLDSLVTGGVFKLELGEPHVEETTN